MALCVAALGGCSNYLVAEYQEEVGMTVEQACVNGILNSTCGQRVTFEDGEVIQDKKNGGGLLAPAIAAAGVGVMAATAEDYADNVTVEGSKASANSKAKAKADADSVQYNKQKQVFEYKNPAKRHYK